MLTNRITPYLLTLLFFFAAGQFTQASAQTFTISDESHMYIYGSANVTDWDAEVKTINGEITINNPEGKDWSEAEASWFESVTVSIPVGDIDADSRRMNRNMHEYLKEDDYPEITYNLVEAEELASLDNPGYKLTVKGNISAAGASHEIVHDVEIAEQENGRLVISGSQDLKMSDFGIEPPTAMLGSVRARDEMTIEFELILEK
ncbi:YceI family protein [Natronogracilivirga saccharolytica]|uniref:YceI family protein n=1 Tax=Natronogracilivirga saccharolytica TaxID=2812953 RepID=A0A8J7RKG8_9BACT|nr:YceI family protein [Natronogracilivirga saccharolytica]MBP3191808.1 YceI family protein [Natronogracilivirga saccharolytica]